MTPLRHALLGMIAALLLLTPAVLDAGETKTFRHSGTLVALDPDTRTIVLEEVGSWQTRNGVTIVSRLRIPVTPSTQFVKVQRAPEPPSGFPGDFVEQAIESWKLATGDFVSIECRHEGKRFIATKITMMTPEE